MPNITANAQTEEKERTERTQIYGCQKYPKLMHCDPILNKFESYQIKGSFSKVYPSSNQNPLFAIGRYNKGLEMHDGYREYLESPIIDNNTVSSNFSVSFWIKKIPDTSPYGYVVSHINKKQTAGWFFDVFTASSSYGESSNQSLRFLVSNSMGNLSGTKHSVPLTSSKFVNIAGTFDGSTVKVYKDGVLFGTSKFVGNYSSNKELPLHVGSAAYCSSCNRWAGIIDDLRLYNRTLAEKEVKEIALSNTADSTLDDLTLHLTFDDNIRDSSGKNNHGRIFTPIGSMAYTQDDRLFFTEKNTGLIRVMKDNNVLQKPFATISDHYVDWEQGLLGLTIDPDFIKNHFIYLYYTSVGNNNNNEGGNPFNRVVRFTEKNNTATEMVVLLDNIPASKGFHSGGGLAFGPDDKLYITVGDATEHEFAQDPSIPIGKILRINRDGTIPKDNPFPGSPVYTLGHRNMYGIAFNENENNTTGIVTENGDYYYDEINLIQKGGNYGFPIFQPPNVAPELSNDSTSIKPIRSYWNTIAPTQAIYYTGDKFPSLKDKFLVASFTGDIYALQIDETSKRIVEEYYIDLENYPFEPAIGIAQSPSGDVYFGGYSIYKLEGSFKLENETRKNTFFPIEIIPSGNIGIRNVEASDSKRYIAIDLYPLSREDNNHNFSFLKIKIPNDLLDKIIKISAIITNTDGTYQQYGKQMNFTLDNSTVWYNSTSGYTTISTQLPKFQKNMDLRMLINGTSAIMLPPLAATSAATTAGSNMSSTISTVVPELYDNFEGNTYTLNDGESSPNGKWQSVYNGGGSSGVKKDQNGNNIFFMYPNISIFTNETHANLVKTAQQFSNFEMSAKVKTDKQLRKDTLSNPWEAAWIFFRYTDEFHYYWFLLKPTGIELGKKDCDTCTNPYLGQIFLYSDDSPILKVGNWSNWEIEAIGNRIIISVNGTRIIDFLDHSMSQQLATGAIGLYTEDSAVSFDDIFVTRID